MEIVSKPMLERQIRMATLYKNRFEMALDDSINLPIDPQWTQEDINCEIEAADSMIDAARNELRNKHS